MHESISASGGNAIGSAGSVSYTVGQIVYSTNSSTSGSVAQGIQQPYEISEVVDGYEQLSEHLYCSVYPNPTTDFLVLEIDNAAEVIYQLYDATGKFVASRIVTDATTMIDMNGLVSGTYFLKILKDNQMVKTYKIIKNK
ncbi:MAG: T9SS type A sorting domain-containing protein [Bacteroidales bacterium]|nr:T9SS type A sorting domain-containing protein [Bacteroidales bacterium]